MCKHTQTYIYIYICIYIYTHVYMQLQVILIFVPEFVFDCLAKQWTPQGLCLVDRCRSIPPFEEACSNI